MREILPLFLCFVFLATAVAQENGEEKRALEFAKRAFQDQLYDVATQKLEQFLKSFPQSASLDEVTWLLGQSLFFQKKYEAALALFAKKREEQAQSLVEKSETARPWLLWEAETLAALQKWPEAREAYRKFIDTQPKEDFLLSVARTGLAYALFYEGKTAEAIEALKKFEGKENQQRSVLLQSKILIANGEFSKAKTLLEKLSGQKRPPSLQFETHYWLGELLLKENQLDQALEQFHQVVKNKQAFPKELVVLSWLGVGKVFKEQEKWEDAAEAFEQAFKLTGNQEILLVSIHRFLESHQKNKTLTSAAQQLRAFAQKTGQAAPLYAIAQSYQQSGNPDAAVAELNTLVKTYPASLWTAEAHLLMANILHQTGQVQPAIDVLQQFAEQKSDSPRLQAIQLRLAELYFASQQFSEAAQIYQQMAQNQKTANPEFEKNLFNALLSFSQADKLEEFLKTEAAYARAFPQSPYLKETTIEKARLLTQSGQGPQAREALEKLISQHPDDSQFLAKTIFLIGYSHYRDADYPAAIQTFQRIETEFPTSLSLANATYHRTLAELQAEKITLDAARKQYTKLLAAYPKHKLAPSLTFQIAQTYYDQQNYGQAEKTFLQFIEAYPKHSLVDNALYFAGKSLMWLTNYEAAIAVFEKIPEKSPLKTEARLAEIDSYRHLGKFQAALKITNSLLPSEDEEKNALPPLTPLQTEALIRKASTLFTLAAENPDLYNETLQTTQKIIVSSTANVTQRNHAGFIRGKTLQKLNREKEALQAYLDVLYGKLLPSSLTGPAQPEYRWFTRCGVEAAQIKEAREDIPGTIAIYRILERLSGPNREEFSQKIQDLRTRHFIWE